MKKYCKDITKFERFTTREVQIGKVKLGASNPIAVQSMTTTDTMDTQGTVDQSLRMVESGCELVRITAPSKKEAENLKVIKDALLEKGCDVPLVADIHFTPNAAEVAARHIEKIRVNPGNYADKKKFEEIEYTNESYQEELERIRVKFTPLVQICKEEGTAMRIGTNHGSLSDRIMSRYGDTANGMVESAMEFLRICADNDYHDLVISMKSSNTQVMVQAYRLLVAEMKEVGMNYPLHLGVTEAGDGEDGRIKSAVGIGTLLEDGLGDTIRVSLTEDPELEAPVARLLANRYIGREKHEEIASWRNNLPYNPYVYQRRTSASIGTIGGKDVPRTIIDLSQKEEISASSLFTIGYRYSVPLDKWNIDDLATDFIFIGNRVLNFEIPGTLGVICASEIWDFNPKKQHYPIFSIKTWKTIERKHEELNFLRINATDLSPHVFELIKRVKKTVLVLTTSNLHGMAEQRRFFMQLLKEGIEIPVIIKREYKDLNEEQFQLYSATDFGALLIDGFGDGVWLEAENCGNLQLINRTLFGVLQATRTRISKTEYISCPSCGRTLFDLQVTTAKIRARTSHLKGVKIGIMGCIVNGPGEMADADYGYVGTGPGKISLYKEKEVVKKNVPEENAVDELIELIRIHGDWVELETVE